MSKLSNNRNERAAVRHLQKNHPEFFKDRQSVEFGACIVARLADDMGTMSTLQKLNLILAVQALMYDMGSAALKTIRDEHSRNMTRIFIDTERSRRHE